MLKVEIQLDGAKAALQRIPPEVATAVAAKVRALTVNLQHHIVADKLQGQVLNHRSGALGRSIQQVTETHGDVAEGRVFSAGDVKYAAIHEFGGKTPAHDIFPKKAEALAFMMGGEQVFAKVVHHPGSVIPERSYMRSGLYDMAEEIIAGIRDAAASGARRAMGEA
jgi:phage gpG-like protein